MIRSCCFWGFALKPIYPYSFLSLQICSKFFFWGFFINQFYGFITSEYPAMVDLVLLHLPCFMDTTRYYLLSAWWCGNPDCRSRIRGHCERIFGSFSWLWSWDGRSFGSSSYWLLSPLLHGICYLGQSPQLPEKMNGVSNNEKEARYTRWRFSQEHNDPSNVVFSLGI